MRIMIPTPRVRRRLSEPPVVICERCGRNYAIDGHAGGL
jgi:hypothetical protein